MKTIPVTLRSIIDLGLGGDSWQTFVDHYEERFDALRIDGFSFDPVSKRVIGDSEADALLKGSRGTPRMGWEAFYRV